MRSLVSALVFLMATSAAAEERMDAEAFEAYVEDRTITFRTDAVDLFGVERYLPGRRVIWSVFDGTCLYGVWFESKGDICFRYEGDPEHKCWAIFDTPQGMRGEFTTRPGTTTIYELADREDPLICNDLSS